MTFVLLLHFLLPFFSNLIDSDFTFYFALASLSLFQIVFRRTETFVALGLLFVLARLIPVVGAVGCPRCGGAVGAACLGDPTKCPMFTDVRTNANILTGVALAAGVVGTTLTVTNLLPPHLRRIFGRTELDFIVSLQRRTEFASGTYSFKKPATAAQLQADSQKTEYDKELSEIIADCQNGLVTQAEAISHLQVRTTWSGMTELGIQQIRFALEAIKTQPSPSSAMPSYQGIMYYVLSKVSTLFLSSAADTASFEQSESGAAGSSRTTFKAIIHRPKSYEDMVSMFNAFCSVCVATGVFEPLSWFVFYEEVVLTPVRKGWFPWCVGFELVLIYFRLIQDNPDRFFLGTVKSVHGGMDHLREEAVKEADIHYDKKFFRPFAGNAKGTPGAQPMGGQTVPGDVPGNKNKNGKCCAAWNLRKPHNPEHLSDAGVCNFVHLCDQFVTDKGPGGQCRGNHRRVDCTYDASKRCKAPAAQ